MTRNEDIVSQAIVKLFETQRFYAEIIAQMKRVYTKKVPVAGVCVKTQPELHLNIETYSQYSSAQRVAILKHECEHLLRDHILRFKEMAPEVYDKKQSNEDHIINNMKHQAMNVSADCAVNSGLPDIPEDCILPEQFDLPQGQTFEWYMEKLKDNEKMKGLTEYDGHSLWSESEGDRATIKEKIRQAINKAAKRTRAAGRMTAEDELLVSELNRSVVDWKRELKRFVARTVETTKEASRRKRNRRYGITIPGSVKVEYLHIGVAIDTSGSVSDEALRQFMSEIGTIANYAKVTVVEADSEIKAAYEFKNNKTYTISGRGGTAYQPAFDYFNMIKGLDGVIYFGDMDSYDRDEIKKPKYPVLWAIVGDQDPPANFGAKTRVLVKENK